VVNLVFQHDDGGGAAEPVGAVYGVHRARMTRRLAGRGRAVAAMFRPAGFRGLLDRPLHTITDRWVPAADVLGPDATALGRALPDLETGQAVAALADLLARRAAERSLPPAAAEVTALAERVAADRSLTRVEQLAEVAGTSVRRLQRAFADHLGASPKWVIRRYRLLEAAERARQDDRPDWAGVARQLGYSDQAHLVREFTRLVGVPPARYARTAGSPAG
jgi:AraC-like DNA-binding protein